MSLIVTKGISLDGQTIYLIDSTVAYGDTLPARNTLAVLAYVVHQKIAGNVEKAILPYDPETASSFGVDVEDNDGVYLGYLFAVPKWSAGPLVDGDIVYDLNDGLLKKQIDSVLTVIELSSLIEEEVEQGSVYALVTTAISIKRDLLELEKLRKLEEYLADGCEYNEYVQISVQYDYVRTLRAASFIEFAKELYVIAEQKLETGNSFADEVIAKITQDS